MHAQSLSNVLPKKERLLYFFYLNFILAHIKLIEEGGDDCFLIVNGGLIACTVLEKKESAPGLEKGLHHPGDSFLF